MVFPLLQTLVKTLAKNLAKNLVKNLAKNLIQISKKKYKSMPVSFWEEVNRGTKPIEKGFKTFFKPFKELRSSRA